MPVQADLSNTVTDASATRRGRVASDDLRWWRAPPDILHERVWAVAERIRKNSAWRWRRNFMYLLMYGDIDANAVYRHYDSLGAMDGEVGAIQLNVVQNAVDTAASLIAKNRPEPLFITDGAEFEDRVKAEDLTRYVAGVFEEADVYEKAQRAFTHAALFGPGALKFYPDEGRARIACEVVPIVEILVDELDGVDEHPTQLHHRKHYPRDVLAEMFPDSRDEILAANSDTRSNVVAQTVGDRIPVVESWHLRSGPKADDGLHTICIENATLRSERYDKDDYPIIFWRWYPASIGFWGRGIVQEIEGIQRSINRRLRSIDEAEELAPPLWVVNRSAQVEWAQLLNNELGRVVEFTGPDAPAPVVPQILPPEVYQHLWNLVSRAYEIVGISQGMAQGQKPPGVESAAAVREVADIASGRFQQVGQRWERFFTRIADVIVDLSKDLYTRNAKLAVRVKDEDALETIEWKDVDMDRDRYRIQVYEISALPATPQGRLAAVTEYMQAGWIPKEAAMSLLNVPDLKRFTNLETSTIDLVQKTIGRIKRKKIYNAEMKPISQMNLALAMQIATMEKVRAKYQNLNDDTLNRLDLYLADLADLMKQQAPPPAPPPPPGAPAMPVGAPPPPMPQMPQSF